MGGRGIVWLELGVLAVLIMLRNGMMTNLLDVIRGKKIL